MRKETKLIKLGVVFAFVMVWIGSSAQPYASGDVRAKHISAQFHVRLFDGTVLTYQDIQGKITVIDFWGTWCKPCLAEIPEYNLLFRDYKSKGVIFIGLAGESGSADKVKGRSKLLNINYPIGVPTKEEWKAIGKIKVYPTTWVIAPSGEIAKEFTGVVSGKQAAIRKLIEDLLQGL